MELVKFNPFCPKCNVMMRSKRVLVESGSDRLGRKMYGRPKVWECPRCKRRYKKGSEAILMKAQPTPKCFGKKSPRGCKEYCEHRTKCGEQYKQKRQKEGEAKAKKTKKTTKKKPKSLLTKKL